MICEEMAWREPVEIFKQFVDVPGMVFLDSAQETPCGHYSFIAIDPFEIVTVPSGGNPFDHLGACLGRFPLDTHQGLPPFQGGAAGFFGYELNRYLEDCPTSRKNDTGCPDMALGLYDLVAGFDHRLRKAWIFSSGYPEQQAQPRRKRAEARMAWLKSQWDGLPASSHSKARFSVSGAVSSHFTRETYIDAVRRVQAFIRAGDIFQANLSRRFHASLPADFSPSGLYLALRERNPAPFAAYVNLLGTQLLSASPERFLKVTEGWAEARPIKGTRPRGKNPVEDSELAAALQASDKDRSENVMIVDLLRNDLSRVCEPHSVSVPALCALESHPAVHHLVSVVTGRLQAGRSALDLLRAAFPGGSITGAPKIRAMEIIADLEPVVRGPYCGSAGYLGFDGSMDTSITIRTYVVRNRMITFQAGGAIVLDSDPEAEFDETTDKIRPLWEVLTGKTLA